METKFQLSNGRDSPHESLRKIFNENSASPSSDELTLVPFQFLCGVRGNLVTYPIKADFGPDLLAVETLVPEFVFQ
jgi:hypothetical protein